MIEKHRAALGALALTAAALVAATPGFAEDEHTTLAIPGATVGFITRYVADDAGLWKQQGLDVKVLDIAGVGSMNAVISGSVDFSMSSGPSITRAMAKGQHLVALATAINESDEDIVIRKDIADAGHFDPGAPLGVRGKLLKGHTFAVGGVAAIPDVVLKVVAIQAGLSRDDVVATPMQPPEYMAAFERKAIDGFVSGPPFIQQALVAGTGVVLSDSAKGEPTEYSPQSAGLLLTRADFCAGHRSICEKMVHGIVEAAKFVHEHRAETIAVAKKYFPTYSDAVLAQSIDMLMAMTPSPPLTTPQMLENGDLINIAAGFLKESDKLARYDDLIDNEFTK
ncbi:MAG TPA: ABC transporter substrate-binding protein [Stellaceae bacterium]|jgi:NitT/TauT family transport system substrate-binding protein|nr:ABC transporter substrate-binding protein [Stellaceae bacterium]